MAGSGGDSREFDEAYGRVPQLFGSEAEKILVDHGGLLSGGSRVLDVGCGQGRNTLYLARREMEVDALDPSREALSQLEAVARREALPVTCLHGTLADLEPGRGPYDGVLIFGLFPLLTLAEIRAAMDRSVQLLFPGGLLWVTTFTTEDPAYESWHSRAAETEGHSFRLASGRLRTFLEPGQLRRLGEERSLMTLHYWEGLGPIHRHGDSAPERHAMAEGLFRSPA